MATGIHNSSLMTHSPCHLAWSEGQQPLDAVLHLSDDPGELLKLLVSYGNTINIVMSYYYYYYYYFLIFLKSPSVV